MSKSVADLIDTRKLHDAIDHAVHAKGSTAVEDYTFDAVMSYLEQVPLDISAEVDTRAGELWEASRTDDDPTWPDLLLMSKGQNVDIMDAEFAQVDVERMRRLAEHMIRRDK